MPKLSLNIPNPIGQADASHRLKSFLERVRSKYQDQVSDLQEEWQEHSAVFSFKTYGFSVKGTLLVEETVVKVDGEIPFAAMMFKGKIEQTVRENLERLLST